MNGKYVLASATSESCYSAHKLFAGMSHNFVGIALDTNLL